MLCSTVYVKPDESGETSSPDESPAELGTDKHRLTVHVYVPGAADGPPITKSPTAPAGSRRRNR